MIRDEVVEQQLAERELHMTTPRSLLRRKVVRALHMAMKRQKDGTYDI